MTRGVLLGCKRGPFACQKGSFRMSRGVLSHAKRGPLERILVLYLNILYHFYRFQLVISANNLTIFMLIFCWFPATRCDTCTTGSRAYTSYYRAHCQQVTKYRYMSTCFLQKMCVYVPKNAGPPVFSSFVHTLSRYHDDIRTIRFLYKV